MLVDVEIIATLGCYLVMCLPDSEVSQLAAAMSDGVFMPSFEMGVVNFVPTFKDESD